jgi:hypothetical protein
MAEWIAERIVSAYELGFQRGYEKALADLVKDEVGERDDGNE